MHLVRWIFWLFVAVGTLTAAPVIVVQVYNPAGVPEVTARRSLDEAGWILRQAGIETRWIACDHTACPQHSDTGHLVLSLLPDDPRGTPASDALGFAVLAGRRNGAAVIYPRVVSMQKDYPHYQEADIIAAVIAHELGHLLLGAPHTGGVMKANWSPADFAAMRQRRLTFSTNEARAMTTELHLRANSLLTSQSFSSIK